MSLFIYFNTELDTIFLCVIRVASLSYIPKRRVVLKKMSMIAYDNATKLNISLNQNVMLQFHRKNKTV